MNIDLKRTIAKICGRRNSVQSGHFLQFNFNNKKLGFEPLEDRRLLSFGPALLLDGVDDYATAADSSSLDLGTGATEDFTIEARINVPDLNGEGRQTIIQKEGAYSLYADFHATQPDQLSFQIWQGDTAYTASATASDLAVGWHHVAAVFDNEWTATQDQLAIYLDGFRVGVVNDTDFNPGIDNASSALNIGAQGNSNPFHGWIDDVRLSDTVRYSGTSYAVPSDAFTLDANTPALWHFDETPGSTSFTDASPNGDTLTGLNGAQTVYTYSPTPSIPDLLDISDSGVSANDNLTNFDNSQPAKALQFSVGNTVAGATVTIYANGVTIGSSSATGTTATVTTNGNYDLTDGFWNITARQTLPGITTSANSLALSVTIDTVAPLLSHPILSGHYPTTGYTKSVVVLSTLAYVVDGSNGLSILDISNPTAPVKLGSYVSTGFFEDVVVSGNYAYLSENYYGLQIIDVSNPAVLVKLGAYVTHDPTSTAISGNIAYVADSLSGLKIIDVSNPAAPVLLGSTDLNDVSDVFISGSLAYVTDFYGLKILNVSNPASPVKLGEYETKALHAQGLVVSGGLAYVADADAGILIIDVSNPAAPMLLGSYDTPGYARSITLSGTLAYVSDDTQGLQVIDVSDPTRPQLIGGYDTTGTAFNGALSGTHAYVADWNAGLQIIDVSSLGPPAVLDLQSASDTGISNSDNITSDNTPTFTVPIPQGLYYRVYRDSLQISGDAETASVYTPAVQANGTYAYTIVAIDGAGNDSASSPALSVTIDVSIPSSPDLLGISDSGLSTTDNITNFDNSIPEKALQFAIDNTIPGATVTLYANGVAIGSTVATGASTTITTNGNYDLSDGNSTITARQTVSGQSESTDSAGLGIVIQTDIPLFRRIGSYDISGYAYDMALSGMLAYVASSEGLAILDISDPANPLRLGVYRGVYAYDVALSGTLAYVAGGNSKGFQILDISNPAAPRQLNPSNSADGSGIALSGSYAYETANGLFRIIDISDPTAPIFLSSYAFYNTTQLGHVVISGSLAYVAGGASGLLIIDVSDPLHPQCIGSYSNSSNCSDVFLSGTLAYVTDIYKGLQIFDVSDSTAPVLVGSCATSGYARAVKVSGTRAYIADNDQGLQIIDVSDPRSPRLLGGYNTTGETWGVVISGTMAYVADGASGIHILDLTHSGPAEALDLQAPSDTGFSNTDNITSDNTPTFSVPLPTELYFRVYRDGVQISGDAVTGNTYTTAVQADGTYIYTVIALDIAGNFSIVSPNLSVTIDSTIPLVPDLAAASDSGNSSTDNITNLDNSGLGKSLQFSVGGTIIGATVTIYADGTAIGSALATGTTTTITTSCSFDLSDGGHTITARQTVAGRLESTDSQPLSIWIDTAAPGFVMPTRKGGYDTLGQAYGVAVSGALAYVADGDAGLQIIDVSNPAAPVWLGGYDTIGNAHGVSISGTVAYVADDTDGLQIFDVSNPAAPVWLGGYDTSGNAYSVAVLGNLAFVADMAEGLQIIDVSNPAAPVRLAGYGTLDAVCGVAASGTQAYLAVKSLGLLIIDASNPAAPVGVGRYDTSGTANGVAVCGALALVADDTDGLQIINVSNPSSPVRTGVFNTSGTAQNVSVSGMLAYVADKDTSLQIIDFSNPAAPVRLSGYNTEGQSYDVAVVGTTVYMADNAAGLQIIDAGQFVLPGAPDLQAASDSGASNTDNITTVRTPTFDIPGTSTFAFRFYRDGSQISGNFQTGTTYSTPPQDVGTYHYSIAYVDYTGNVSARSPELTVVIGSAHSGTPGTPDLLAVCDSGNSNTDNVTNWDNSQTEKALQFSISGTIVGATVILYADGIAIGSAVATATTTTIIINGNARLAEGMHSFMARQTQPGLLESYNSTSLRVTIDTTAPTAFNPQLLGSYFANGTAFGIVISGNLAYEADGSLGLLIFDVTNPAAPVQLGACDTSGTARGVVVAGTLAYVADSDAGLQIIGVSNPAAPVRLGGYVTTGSAYGVKVRGSLAYVAAGSAGLQIIDVSNPAAPVLVGGYDTSGSANSVEISGTLAYVADAWSGLQIIDVSNPTAPVFVGTYDTSGSANDVAVSGFLVYLADASAGLQLISASNPSAPERWGGYDTTGSATGVAVSGTLVFVADGTSGLQIIDMGNPAAPVRLGGYDTSGSATGLAVCGGVAYIADANSGLQIVNLGISDIPLPPNLQSGSDTGMSNSDNITTDTTPTFDVSVPSNAYFRFFRDEVLLSGNYATGTSYTTGLQTGGTYNYSISAVDAAGNVSNSSTSLSVVIDTQRPTVQITPVMPDPRYSAVSTVDTVFSEPIDSASFTYADLTLTRDSYSVTLNSTVTVSLISGTTYRINGLSGFTSTGGTYVFTVKTSGISDVAGNLGSVSTSDTWIKNIDTPTDISLSATTISENLPIGTVIGTFTTTDPNPDDIFNYSLYFGGTDNGSFAIVGDTLQTNAVLDFESKASYSIRVRSTDASGNSFLKLFSIAAIDQPETVAVGASNWTNAGLTLTLGSDGKLHFYVTGSTTNAIPPHNPDMIVGVSICGRSINDVAIDDFSGQYAILMINHATLNLNRDNTFVAATQIVIDGGVLNYNGHATEIGDLTMINNGSAVVTNINNHSTSITSGTLTATSIVCGALIIGSIPEAANAIPVNSTNEKSIPTDKAPLSVSSDALVEKNAIISTSNGIPTIVEQPRIDRVREESLSISPLNIIPITAAVPTIAPSVMMPVISQACAVIEIASTACLREQKEQEHNELIIADPLSRVPLGGAIHVDINLKPRVDDQHSFSNPLLLTERIKDLVHGDLADYLAETKRQLPIALTANQYDHRLAIQSFMREYPHDSTFELEDSELFVKKQFLNQDKLAKKAVDDFHLQLVASD